MDNIKSIIRHILTSVGAVLVFFNVPALNDFVAWISENLDLVFNNLDLAIGALTALFGFFIGRDDSLWNRLKELFKKKETPTA